jgi:hypothetical protein
VTKSGNWISPSAAEYRIEAARCRAIGSDCLHRPTGDALRELADEYDAAADRLEARARGKSPAAEFAASLRSAY